MWLRLTETLFQLITQSWRALTGRSADEGFHHRPVSVQLHGLHVLLVKLFDINRNHKHVDGINQLTMTYIHVQCTFNISFGKDVLRTDDSIWTGQVSESSLCQIRWVQLCCVVTAIIQTDRHDINGEIQDWKIHIYDLNGVYVNYVCCSVFICQRLPWA